MTAHSKSTTTPTMTDTPTTKPADFDSATQADRIQADSDFIHTLPPSTPPPSLADFDTRAIDQNAPPFVLVDGSYYLFRCFYGLPPLSNAQGLPTNAVRGVLNALNKLIKTYNPSHMVVAFDTKAPTFRHQMSEHYKASRKPAPDELIVQIPYVHRLINALGIPLIKLDGYEADDIIGTLAFKACQNGHRVVISTGDKDMAQLVNDCVILEDSFKGQITDSNGVIKKFGVKPNQIVDYLTLMGDASDGIRGVPQVGGKTAQKLLNDYGDLATIIQNAHNIKGAVGKNLLAHQDHIATDKMLATIVTNLDLPYTWDDFILYQYQDKTELLHLYRTLEFKKELTALQPPDTLQPPELLLAPNNRPLNTNKVNANQDIAEPTARPDANHSTNKNNAPSLTTDYHTITTQTAFNALINELKNAPYFAIDTETTSVDWQQAKLVGISLCFSAGSAYYIPLAHVDELGVALTNQLDKTEVLAQLKPLLENPAIGKIGQHLKYDAHIFNNEGITINHWQMDTMLASYVLNAGATRHNMDALAKHYLGIKTTTFEDIAGRGKKQLTFDKIALDIASHYACEDADITFQLFELFTPKLTNDPVATRLLHRLELPIAQILTQMERVGILVNRPFLMKLSAEFEQGMHRFENTAYELAGTPFNLASPKQLGEILFDKLAIAGGKKTKTGQYATDESILESIDHPLAEVALAYRHLAKLKSTYTDALDQVADKAGRVHTSYHQAFTSTGRLSSAKPNLQNIPIRTDTGRQIREAFVAPKGRVLLAADYSQIELRLMAHFSQDTSLIDAFHRDIDIHSKTASEILGKAIDEISPNERRAAKAVNFGLLYGMSAFGLARQLKISQFDAKAYVDRYFDSYPSVYDYMQNTKNQAIENGFVQTILGRQLYTPDVKSNKHAVKEAALRAAINAPLQGSAAEIIKLAMIAVNGLLPDYNANLLLQVHDELVIEADEDKADTLAKTLQHTMQNVLSDTAKQLGFEVQFLVPLVVEVGIGDNWDQAH